MAEPASRYKEMPAGSANERATLREESDEDRKAARQEYA